MYTYNEIEKLLSPTALDVLREEGVYEIYKTEAENIIKNYTGLSSMELIATAKIPFVFVLEYLVYNKLSITSPEHGSKVEEAYKMGLSLLDKIKERKMVLSTTRIGLINSDYSEY
jgi:hypothetical protein